MDTLRPSPRDLAIAGRRDGHIYPDGHYAVIRHAGLAPASESVARALCIKPETTMVRRERVHYNGANVAMSVSTSWFPAELTERCPRLLKCERIPEGTPNYIAACTGLDVQRGLDIVVADEAESAHAELLGVTPGSPVLRCTSYWHGPPGSTLEFGESISARGHAIAYDYAVTTTS